MAIATKKQAVRHILGLREGFRLKQRGTIVGNERKERKERRDGRTGKMKDKLLQVLRFFLGFRARGRQSWVADGGCSSLKGEHSQN